MTFKLKDPGSAITHFIGMMMALLATIPLLVKAAREPDWLHLIALSVFALSMFLLYTASTTYHSLDISAKGKPTTAENGSYDDLRSDRRKLHPNLSDRSERSHRKAVMYPGMERGTGWNHRESLLDHLPEVVFFCNLHRHGVAVCAGILPDLSRTVQTCVRMAAGRRHYLYHRWHHLRIESADL